MPDFLRFRDWLVAETLPLWRDDGYDARCGGFHEKLGFDRAPITGEGKRILVQARQCFTFSVYAGALDGAGAAARSGFDFMTAYGRHPEGGWRHRVARDGAPLDDTRDLYDQAFAIFASAAMIATCGRADARDIADQTLDYLDRERSHPAGGYTEAVLPDGRVADTPRRQNPHMHLFEALLALYEAAGDAEYLGRAERLFALARSKFIVDGTLREYFTDALTPMPGPKGRIVEPGHHMEWVWLLHRYAALADDAGALAIAEPLYDFALAHGYDQGSGGLFDEVTADGSVHRADRRLWPQTEALRAHAVRWERYEDTAARARIDSGIATLMRDHLTGPRGGWQEHIHADGENFYGSLPASSLYHLSSAASEVERVLTASGEMPAEKQKVDK